MVAPERGRFLGERFDLAKILHRDHPRARLRRPHWQAQDSLWPLRVDTVGRAENQIRQGSC
jgi:hypothetical protein